VWERALKQVYSFTADWGLAAADWATNGFAHLRLIAGWDTHSAVLIKCRGLRTANWPQFAISSPNQQSVVDPKCCWSPNPQFREK